MHRMVDGQAARAVCRVSFAWLLAAALLVCVIWGNSLVPGEGSGSLSLAVMHAAQGALRALGLPWEWLTNFIVRKTAHFTEYLLLGVVMMRAWRPHLPGDRGQARPRWGTEVPRVAAVAATAALLLAVPSLDETIQRFVAGRSSQLTDVMIDCAGAATGVALTIAASKVARGCAR